MDVDFIHKTDMNLFVITLSDEEAKQFLTEQGDQGIHIYGKPVSNKLLNIIQSKLNVQHG